MLADFDAQPGRMASTLPELSPIQREADEAELYAGLRGVAGIVAGARGVIDLLRDVAEFAAQAIPGADGVGVALIEPITWSPTINGSASAECIRIRATRPPKCGQRLSLPSGPLTVARRDCIQVMHGPSFISLY